MKSLGAALLISAALCVTPISLHVSPGANARPQLSFDTAVAADLAVPVRHHRRYAAYRVRTYDRFCDGPYTGGGFNGGTYYGGPWIDLDCYNYVH